MLGLYLSGIREGSYFKRVDVDKNIVVGLKWVKR